MSILKIKTSIPHKPNEVQIPLNTLDIIFCPSSCPHFGAQG
jgi:hypothetical protein